MATTEPAPAARDHGLRVPGQGPTAPRDRGATYQYDAVGREVAVTAIQHMLSNKTLDPTSELYWCLCGQPGGLITSVLQTALQLLRDIYQTLIEGLADIEQGLKRGWRPAYPPGR